MYQLFSHKIFIWFFCINFDRRSPILQHIYLNNLLPANSNHPLPSITVEIMILAKNKLKVFFLLTFSLM